jgi:tellurite methyltransferase
MSIDDRRRWEHRHRDAASLKPRPSLHHLPPAVSREALALDLACGQGRHGRSLAAEGYRVVACDVSRRALLHARAPCTDAESGLLFPVQADVDDWCFREGVFDLVVQVDFLDRRLFPRLRDCLRPGGLLLIDTFLDDGSPNAEGPSNTSFLLAPGELLVAFPGFDILLYEERRSATSRATLLARKAFGRTSPAR